MQAGVYDAFAAKLKEAVAKLKVGNGMEDGVTQGPLINADAVAKVEQHIADAKQRGAERPDRRRARTSWAATSSSRRS